jgi:hypothetical protein
LVVVCLFPGFGGCKSGSPDKPPTDAGSGNDHPQNTMDAGRPDVRDCLPTCVAALRASCERPARDAGASCSAGAGVYCYSNGIHETHATLDAGTLYTFTQPDGVTTCYLILSERTTGIQRFETAAGQEVAEAMYVDGGYSVTCSGETTIVNPSDPSCASLSFADCADAAACP